MLGGCANTARRPLPPAAAPAVAAAPLTFNAGGTTNFEVALSDALRRVGGQGTLSPVQAADVAVAVPPNFEAAHPWPLLVVSATSDPGYTGSRRAMKEFVGPALAAGWVVVAADPAEPYADAADENLNLRYALIRAALGALAGAWPGSEQWPLAFAGFSGGAKASGYVALVSTIEHRMPVGIFLGGCGEATPATALKILGQPVPGFANVPIFLSSGDADPIASPRQQRSVERQLREAGFTQVRLESYAGGHQLSAEHVREALEWFTGQGVS